MAYWSRTPLPLRSRQHGLGALGWLVVLAIASFALTCFFRIGPVYLEYWQAKKAVDEVFADGRAAGQSRDQLKASLQRFMDVNRIEVITLKDIRFEQTKGGYIVDASYEKRVPLVANIDVVVKFDNFKYTLSAAE